MGMEWKQFLRKFVKLYMLYPLLHIEIIKYPGHNGRGYSIPLVMLLMESVYTYESILFDLIK